jgi:hypothetical protein
VANGRRADELLLTSDTRPLTSDWEVAQPAERAVVTRKVPGFDPQLPSQSDDRGRATEDGIDPVTVRPLLTLAIQFCGPVRPCVRQRALPAARATPDRPGGQGSPCRLTPDIWHPIALAARGIERSRAKAEAAGSSPAGRAKLSSQLNRGTAV